MRDRLRFLLNRLRERLWIKPLLTCLLSIAGVFLARVSDNMSLSFAVPDVSQQSIIELLKIIAASMLAIATFAVASMVAAYAAAGQVATARAFPLIIADDVSQNALSTFIGAFIFSVVGLSAAMNGYYERAGRCTLFVLMVLVMLIVVVTFVRWVDRIARLGRLGAIVAKVEQAAAAALERHSHAPLLGGAPITNAPPGSPVYADTIGYVQRIDVAQLHAQALRCQVRVTVNMRPGTFANPSRPLCFLAPTGQHDLSAMRAAVQKAFVVGVERRFDEDPRFGLLALSEIACRALSPGINDPGTAINVLGSLHRLLAKPSWPVQPGPTQWDRVAVPELAIDTLFDDAFNAIARDGAGKIEVAMRLQRHLGELGQSNASLRHSARRHANLGLARATQALDFPGDLVALRARHADYWPP